MILIYAFFISFYALCIFLIVNKVKILKSNDTESLSEIKLYNDGTYSTNLKNTSVKRLSNKSIRSSTRYHNSLYEDEFQFEEYKKEILNLDLP